MEVNAGYKQTEIGIFPSDWNIKPCSAISDLITVGIVIRPTQYYVKQGVPALRSANVREDGINNQDMVFISEKANKLLSKSQLKTNDVVSVRTGYPGTSAVVPSSLEGANCIDLLITRPLKSINSKYLVYWINSPHGKDQILRNQGGLAQQHFNVGELRNLVVAVPPTLAEQEAIAAALSDVDSLLATLDELIAKKRLIKQGAMQQLLTGKKRLSEFSNEWKTRKLGDLGKCLRGVSYKGESDLSSSDTVRTTRLLRSNNVQSASVIFEGIQFVNSQRVSDHQILRDNDILICMANGSKDLVGKAASFQVRDHYKYTFGAFMGCFRMNSSESFPPFVSQTFQTNRYRDYIANLIAGSSINNLKPSDIESIEIPLPRLPEQIAIAKVLSDMDAEIATLEARREKTSLLKQGMMQELLTGKTRLV